MCLECFVERERRKEVDGVGCWSNRKNVHKDVGKGTCTPDQRPKLTNAYEEGEVPAMQLKP